MDPDTSLRAVLSERRGGPAEKALLLQAMLKAVEIGSQLVWARARNRGAIDAQLPNPNWFDTLLVGVTLDGDKFFLDPTDRALGFGQIMRAGWSMPALLRYHAVMSKQLTIRGVSDEVGQRLEKLSRARGQSVNTTVLKILEAAVGGAERRARLARYVTWTPEDLAEFGEALAAQRTIDEPLWR